MELNEILSLAARKGASDIHFKGGRPPLVRLHGNLIPFKDAAILSADTLSHMAASIMNGYQRERFNQYNELDMSYSVAGIGRFRVNVFQQRSQVGMVFRTIPLTVSTIGQLNLPKVIETIALEARGLILVTGTTGSGKSTTLAAMIDHINKHRAAHVMTIEDPIEFVFRDSQSVINQREVGVDTLSFGQALRAALRQDPDVILVGEMRDLETTETALTAAETGHLVLSTVHTIDVPETVHRVVSLFPPHQQKLARVQLASTLRAVIAQRLVQKRDGRGRVPAVEIMRNTPRIRELIENKDRTKEIAEAIVDGAITYNMQSFDQALMKLLKLKMISYEQALAHTSNPSNFALRVRGIESTPIHSGMASKAWLNRDLGRGPKPVRYGRVRGRDYDKCAISDHSSPGCNALVDAMGPEDFGEDERLPYWSSLWPSAITLARYILEDAPRLASPAIELGAGLGLVSLALAFKGVSTLSTDYEPDALSFLRQNAKINGLSVETKQWDWRDASGLSGPFSTIVAADVLYEDKTIQPVANAIDRLLAPDGQALISDPDRPLRPDFEAALRLRNLSVQTHSIGDFMSSAQDDPRVFRI